MRFENVRVHKSMMITKLNGEYGKPSLRSRVEKPPFRGVPRRMSAGMGGDEGLRQDEDAGRQALILHPNIGQPIAEQTCV